jgi:hypothetical protein
MEETMTQTQTNRSKIRLLKGMTVSLPCGTAPDLAMFLMHQLAAHFLSSNKVRVVDDQHPCWFAYVIEKRPLPDHRVSVYMPPELIPLCTRLLVGYYVTSKRNVPKNIKVVAEQLKEVDQWISPMTYSTPYKLTPTLSVYMGVTATLIPIAS